MTTYKVPSIGFNSMAPDRTPSSVLSFIRDSALFAYLIFIFTAHIDLLYAFGDGRAVAMKTQLVEGSLFSQIMVSILFGVSILLQFAGQTPVRRIVLTAVPLLPIMIWIGLSVMWSDFQDVSVRRAARLVMEMTTIILIAAAYQDQYKLLRVIYLNFSLIVMADIALLSVPEISFTPIGYAGAHYSKQLSGTFCMVALPLFLLAIMDRRIFPSRLISVVFTLCCLLVLALSLSKSAQGLTFICLVLTVCFIALRTANSIAAFVVTLIAGGAIALAIATIASIGVDNFLMSTIGDTTITGRDMIWYHALSLFWQSPLVGRGYGGIWNVGTYSVLQLPNMSETFILKEAHNGYIDILAELGIIGLILAIVFIASIFYQVWHRIPFASVKRINFIALYTCLAIILENIFVSSIFRSGDGFWLYFLLVTHASIFISQAPRRHVNR